MPHDQIIEEVRQLSDVRAKVLRMPTLSSILTETWFEAVKTEICQGTFGAPINDPAGIVDKLVNRPDLVDLLESRLSALNAVPFKRNVVETKLNQLRGTVTTTHFRNHLFEAGVLGDFAIKGILKDIDDDATGVDGVVDFSGRDVLVEATNTAQEFINDFEGAAFVGIDREVNQVALKVRMKASSGRQIAKAEGRPALLFLALTRRGADPLSARDAIEGCLDDPACAGLSGVVVAASWAFLSTSWYGGRRPQNPLTAGELERLTAWYA